MRPIELRFKGLNSYINEQVVDFNKLTSKGLFGIFGPTGSGKSTILDGITLALYGDLSRKSKEYINTNCQELTIQFKFSLKSKDGVMIYSAERSQKKDKNGGIRTTYARLIKHGESDEILADKPSDMKDQIITLLGLTMDDFTRSVVLPQGKFSDFLKLTGKDRRVMLERIFALEKYGRKLSEKLKHRYDNEKIKENYLNGQLKRYEGINEEVIKTLKLEKQALEDDYIKTKTELEKVNNKYEKHKEIWQLQNELVEKEKKLHLVLEQQEYMKNLRSRVTLAEKAHIISPHIEYINKTNTSISENKLHLEELSLKLDKLTENKIKYEEKLRKVEEFESNDLSKWHEKIGSLKEAIELLKKEQEIEKEAIKLENQITNYKDKIKRLEDDIKKHQDNSSELNKFLEDLSVKEKDSSVKTEYKLLIDEGLQIQKEKNLRSVQLNELKEELSITINIINESKGLMEQYDNETALLSKGIEECTNRLNDLAQNNPGDLDYLTVLQQEIMDLKNLQDNWDVIQKKLNQLDKEKDPLIKDIVKQSELLKQQRETLEVLQVQKSEIDEVIQELRGKHIAATIAGKLQIGEACPVCGSTEHVNLAAFNDDKNIVDLENKKTDLQDKLDAALKAIQSLEVNMIAKQRQEFELNNEYQELTESQKDNDINEIKDSYGSKTEEFKSLKVKIQVFKEENEAIQKTLAKLNDEFNNKKQIVMKYKENVKLNQDSLVKLTKKIQQEENILSELHKTFDEYKAKTDVEDFQQEKSRIIESERLLEKLSADKKQIQDQINKLYNTIEEKNRLLHDYKVSIERDINTNKINETEKVNLKIKIDYLSDNRNPIEYLKDVQEKITKYQEGAKKVRENFQYYLQKHNDFTITKAKKEQALIELASQLERQMAEKDRLLKEYSFESDQQVLNNLITMTEIKENLKVIEEYDEKLKNIIANVNNLKSKLNNEKVTEEEYNLLINKKCELEEKKDNLIKQISEKDTKLIEITNSLVEVNKLMKEKETIDHSISMLEDLSKLIKGNKFIEYVSKSQFHYIVNEASKRLNELTGRYGIELDDQGEFLIRDDKNGGALREAATLSGGETFLTSLALALALSSHIQLKGSYPLEFFFLDEGFGTLDSELLDVVMDSLEKLNNSKITVGIISHVEELKNRVPVKLLISPSIESGSEILLEYS